MNVFCCNVNGMVDVVGLGWVGLVSWFCGGLYLPNPGSTNDGHGKLVLDSM